MKTTRLLLAIVLAVLSTALLRGQADAKRPAGPARPAKTSGPSPEAPPQGRPAESEPVARVMHYSAKDVVKLNAKLRYTTLIILPKSEKILDFTCGDKEYWVVNGAENMAYIKPAKAGAQTDLNLITASGNIYSFVLTEVSDSPGVAPDLKVFIEPKDESMLSAANAKPRFVSAQDVDDFRQQAELAHKEVLRAKQEEQAQIDKGISHFVSSMRFSYEFKAFKKPFNVVAMYHDDKFTYIQARPSEIPVIYEFQDGMPNLVNFDYADGLYTVRKVLDRGYLVIGKAKLYFTRKD